MPPMPLRFTSAVRMLSRMTVCRRSSSRSRDPPSIRLTTSSAARAGSLMARWVPAITARRKPFTASGFGGGECRVDDQREAVSLAAVIGIAQHGKVIGGNAAVPQIDAGKIGKPGHGVDLARRQHRFAHGGADPALLDAGGLDSVLPRQRRPQPDRQVAFGDAERLAVDVGQRLNAAAPAGNDGVGRLVEQHEHRLDRRRAGLVAKADQFVDVDQREVAGPGGDAGDAIQRSAGDIGIDRQSLRTEQTPARPPARTERRWHRSDGRAKTGSRPGRAFRPQRRHSARRRRTPRPSRTSSEVRKQRTALVDFARIAITSGGPMSAAAPAMFVSWRTGAGGGHSVASNLNGR